MCKRIFNTGDPLAYLITWTTYGTWLPGDERGWNRKDKPETQLPNFRFEETARDKMKETRFLLSPSDRLEVEKTIRKHCDVRGWLLHAVNARSNHVHTVVTAIDYAPDSVVRQLKAWCTRKLKVTYPERTSFWTEGSSRRWINQEDGLNSAVEYVVEAQDRKKLEE